MMEDSSKREKLLQQLEKISRQLLVVIGKRYAPIIPKNNIFPRSLVRIRIERLGVNV